MAEKDRSVFGVCAQHGTHCKAIEYLEGGIDEVKKDLWKKTVDLKDARKSMTHDLERFEDMIKINYVSRAEFEPVKKLAYGLAALMLAYAFRMVVL